MTEKRTTTFEFADATLEVHTRTVGDAFDSDEIAVRLSLVGTKDSLYSHFKIYADVLVSTRAIKGGLGLVLGHGQGSSIDELQAGFKAFRELPEHFLTRWEKAVIAVSVKPEPATVNKQEGSG